MLNAFSQRWCSVASEQDDRNFSSSRLALQIVKEPPSVTATEGSVRHDDVRAKVPSPAVGCSESAARDCLETESHKALDVPFTRGVAMVDDKTSRREEYFAGGGGDCAMDRMLVKHS